MKRNSLAMGLVTIAAVAGMMFFCVECAMASPRLQGVVFSVDQAGPQQIQVGTADAQISAESRNLTQITAEWKLAPDGTLQRSLDAGTTWEMVPVANAVFHAVAAIGSEVWVGGSMGALYHSSDGGAHWMRVVPVAENQGLSEDIIAMDFSNALEGELVTSGRKMWTTTDAGEHWKESPIPESRKRQTRTRHRLSAQNPR
jgi:photosystem II stability/assembly factor-like uncharacterized protein